MTSKQKQELLDKGFVNIILDKDNKPNWKEDFDKPCYVYDLIEGKRYAIDPYVIKG